MKRKLSAAALVAAIAWPLAARVFPRIVKKPLTQRAQRGAEAKTRSLEAFLFSSARLCVPTAVEALLLTAPSAVKKALKTGRAPASRDGRDRSTFAR